ncbi:MAG: OmpH family outer membrane protein [Candidatus Pelagibacter sp.]
MKKKILIFILLNILTLNSKAEIVYIDINFILNSSDVGKNLNTYLEIVKNKNSLKYKEIENDLVNKEKSLIAQQNILDKEQFQKKLKKLTSEVQKYRSDKKVSLEELNNIKINKTKEILSALNPIITKYVDENSISIVIPKKNIVVGRKNLDITNQIIKLLNNNITKLEF